MSKALNYDRKLARMIRLADGGKLRTLRDASDLLAKKFRTVTVWETLGYAIEALMRAAETGKRADVITATDPIERVLRARHMLRRE